MSVKSAKDTRTGEEEELFKPIFLMIEKSRPTYVYPLKYEKEFPYYAKETVIDKSSYGCAADLNDYSPTCGWQYDEEGEKIWHSQGFCCACSLSEIVWT